MTARFKRKFSEALEPAVFRAVAAVVEQHPILSAIPAAEETTAPYFVRLDHILLERVITFIQREGCSTDPDHLDAFLEHQHNRPFSHETPPLPYWRIGILQDPADASSTFTLCFCFHHSLADTRSALIFLEDLELALSHPSDTRLPVPTTVPSPPTPLLPPLEALYPLPTPAAQEPAATPAPTTTTWWTASPQTLPVCTRFRSLRLSPSAAALRAAAKRRGATLTAAVMALLAAAFWRVLPRAFGRLRGDCAASLRGFLPGGGGVARGMGVYVGAFGETYARGEGEGEGRPCWDAVWADARRTKGTIDGMVGGRGEGVAGMVGALMRVPDVEGWLLGGIGGRRAAAFELSNVGVLAAAPGGAVEGGAEGDGLCAIERVVFSQSASATAGAVKVSAVTGRDGVLVLGFSWQVGVVEDGVVEGVMEKFGELADMVVHGS